MNPNRNGEGKGGMANASQIVKTNPTGEGRPDCQHKATQKDLQARLIMSGGEPAYVSCFSLVSRVGKGRQGQIQY